MLFVSDYFVHRKTIEAAHNKKKANKRSARNQSGPVNRSSGAEYAKNARANLAKENNQAAKTITSATEVENRRRYRKIYDLFFARGGVAWYEAITAQSLDRKRIFRDIEYFIRSIETAVILQDLKAKGNIASGRGVRIANRLERERMAILAGYEHYSPEMTHRRVMVSFATSSWADMDKMKEIYVERDRVTNETGVVHHVDHIVPIVNKKVCGLNNEFNLRVIPGRENLIKSNKFNV